MAPIDHHFTLAGVRWLLRFTRLRGNAAGWAYLPDAKNPQMKRKILIDDRLKGRSLLETIIHECLHACFPQLSEETVTEAARDIARVLWLLGYRGEAK
jgi:predicted SprT family Zn-dependent metalloprotease